MQFVWRAVDKSYVSSSGCPSQPDDGGDDRLIRQRVGALLQQVRRQPGRVAPNKVILDGVGYVVHRLL